MGGEPVAKGVRGLNPDQLGPEPGAAQMPFQQRGVIRIVFYQQNPEGTCVYGLGGHSFSTNQYMPSWRVASAKSVKFTGLRM